MRVIIDDERTHNDGGRHYRTSQEALAFLKIHGHHEFIDELWLDHDLGGDDTIRPVVDLLEEMAFRGHPFPIGVIYAHTANPVGARYITNSRLLNITYTVRRVGLEAFQGGS